MSALLCAPSPRAGVLAVLFRQARLLEKPIGLRELRQHGALAGPPQSIGSVHAEAMEWLRERLAELWENYGGVGGLRHEDFADYYSACPLGIAIKVGDVHPLDQPVPLTAIWGGAVPQSFAYLPPELLDRLSA